MNNPLINNQSRPLGNQNPILANKLILLISLIVDILFFMVCIYIWISYGLNSFIKVWMIWFITIGGISFCCGPTLLVLAHFIQFIIWIWANFLFFGSEGPALPGLILYLIINCEKYLLILYLIVLLIIIIFGMIIMTIQARRIEAQLYQQAKKRQVFLAKLNNPNQIQLTQIYNDQSCSICLNKSSNLSLDCRHNFHLECIKAWVQKRNTCPVCRAILY